MQFSYKAPPSPRENLVQRLVQCSIQFGMVLKMSLKEHFSIQHEMPLVFCPTQQCPKSEVWGMCASCEHQNLVVRKALPGEALSIIAISRAVIFGGITSFSQLAVPSVYPETLVCVLFIKSLRCSIWGIVVSTAAFHSVFYYLYLVFQWNVLASIRTAGSHGSKHNGLHNNPVAFIDTLPGKSTFMGM